MEQEARLLEELRVGLGSAFSGFIVAIFWVRRQPATAEAKPSPAPAFVNGHGNHPLPVAVPGPPAEVTLLPGPVGSWQTPVVDDTEVHLLHSQVTTG